MRWTCISASHETERNIPEGAQRCARGAGGLDYSAQLRTAFGEVVDHYLHCGHWEQFEYDRRITDHELIRGFERA